MGTLLLEGGDGGACVTDTAVAAEVRARLGRQGLVPDSNVRFVVTESGSSPFVVTLTIRQPELPDSVRTFTSTDCGEVVESVALAIAVSLDPAVLLVVPKRPPPVKQVEAPEPTPPPPPLPPLIVGGGLLGGLALGLSPGPTATLGAFASLRRQPFDVRLEGRLELPREVTAGSNTVSAFSAIGTFSAGWNVSFVRVSLPLSVGGLFLSSPQGDETFRGTRVVVLAGPEVAARWSPLPWLSLEGFVRAQFVPTRVSVLSGVQTLWVTWPVSVLVGVVVHFSANDARE